VLVVTPSVPSGSLQEFVAYAKQHTGKVFFGPAGAGTTSHMFLELFQKMAGVEIVPVHYKGGNQQVIDLLGGHSHGTIVSLPTVRPHIASGKLKALGTTSARRIALLPDVPSLSEAGVPGYDAIVWWGFLAPAGTPPPIVARLDKAIEAVLTLDEVRTAFGTQGVEPDYQGSARFGALIAKEMRTWVDVVKKGNIKLE
jgi:tripartite-type tricarboxylate transporter receptor subunit TctC